MNDGLRDHINTINQRIKELNSLYRIAACKSEISDGEVCIWSILLHSKEEYSQQNLSDILSLPRQTVNSLISNFVKKGFATLEHIPGTRNQKVIRLTDTGIQYGESNVKWIFEAEQRAMEGSDPQEIEAMISTQKSISCGSELKLTKGSLEVHVDKTNKTDFIIFDVGEIQ